MKFIIDLGNKTYVIDGEKMEALYAMFDGEERYSAKWNRGEGDEEAYYTHHVWTEAVGTGRDASHHDVKMMSKGTYAMAKIAGEAK